MKMKKLILILLFSILLLLSACDNTNGDNNSNDEQIFTNVEEEVIDSDEDIMDDSLKDEILSDDLRIDELFEDNNSKSDEDSYIDNQYTNVNSPFTGLPISSIKMQKAIMVVVENSPAARPQSGLHEASIIYETLVEGGITRFLALYWDEIPNKIGPIRSARPYQIEIAKEYDALFLNAGGSPKALTMLANGYVESIDQIYSESKYFYRSNERKPPHNLYTGRARILDYLNNLLGYEYKDRFDFQRVSFLTEDDQYADCIDINLWGGTKVVYRYNEENNNYLRYYGSTERPHFSDNIQLKANNIIIQYVRTGQIDEVGRLEMDLDDRGKALLFKDGIVIEGFWENTGNTWTTYYDNLGQEYSLNPGQTWIILVPSSIQVDYYIEKESSNHEDRQVIEDVIIDENDF